MLDDIKEYCGVFGVIGDDDAAKLAYLGLYALQHRGQESAGIVSSDGCNMFERKGLGLVNEVFADDKTLLPLTGDSAIGHNRYSTTGSTLLVNTQPFLINFHGGKIAAAHNGNLVNAQKLRREMELSGSIFRTTTDSEVIMHLIARSKRNTVPEMVAEALVQLEGAYSLVFLTPQYLMAAKDPRSFRPLVLGKRNGAYFVASETCAFDLVGAEYIRSLEAGELIIIERGKEPVSLFPQGRTARENTAACIFEFIYFARPDSIVFDTPVDKIRRRMGARLADEQPATADIVISVPDSSNTAALGYAHRSNIPFEIGLIRNHYIGRTFIQPSQRIREIGVKLKFNIIRGALKGKRIVVVDDSIVRGTTSRQLVSLLREGGATEIHMRIASPPVVGSCFYGIDTPDREKLLGFSKNIDEMNEYLGTDTLGFLSLEGMLGVQGLPRCGFCAACFGTPYPIDVADSTAKEKMSFC